MIRRLERQLANLGVTSERRSNPFPSVRECLSFNDPKGTGIDVFTQYKASRQDFKCTGIVPNKLGHVAFTVTDVKKMVGYDARRS